MHHPLGTLLLQEHMLREEDLERVEHICREHACSFEDAVTRLDLLTPETLTAFKEHLPTLALSQLTDVDPNVLDLLPAELARRYQCIPVASIGGTITVALADPSDEGVLGELSDLTGRAVDAVPALEADLAQVVAQHYAGGSEAAGEADPADQAASEGPPPAAPADPEPSRHPEHTKVEVFMPGVEDPPEQVVLANRLLCQLVVRGAERLEIRWKGDTQSGIRLFDDDGMHQLAAVSPGRAAQVIQRYRVLADLLMASHKAPQSASFSVRMRFENGSIEDRAFDLEIRPIGDLEGEVATLQEEGRRAPREGAPTDRAAGDSPAACSGCGARSLRPGYLYCPMCGLARP